MSAADEPIPAQPPVRPHHSLELGGVTRCSSPASSRNEQGALSPLLQRPESFREITSIGAGGTAQQPSAAESQTVNQPQTTCGGSGSSGGIRHHLRRWLCGWACFGARAGSSGGSRVKRRSGARAHYVSRSATLQQPGGTCGSPADSLGGPSRRSQASSVERTEASAGGLVLTGANSTGGSSDSHVGPLPSRQLHLRGSQDGGSGRSLALPADATGGGGPAAAAPVTAAGPAVQPLFGRSTTTPSSASNISSLNSGRDTLFPDAIPLGSGGAVPGGGSIFAAAGSRASSVASYASGGTTTSRPSRWGLLAGILSAGLRSLSTQLAGVVEPDTGNLSLAAVQDLTRRASCLDVVRAAGQVGDLTLIGSGSMGLVYRGRIANPTAGGGSSSGGGDGVGGDRTVAIKYLVARGTDGMAAPATEGLLSRALAHPNIIATFSWHVTRITPDNFLELPEALAAMAAREQRKAAAAAAKHGRRGGGKGRRTGGGVGGGGSCGAAGSNSALRPAPYPSPPGAAVAAPATRCRPSSTTLLPAVVLGLSSTGGGTGTGGGGSTGVSGAGAVLLGVEGGGGPREGRMQGGRAASATFTANVLDMVRASAAAGAAAVPRARPISPGGSPLTRLVLSRHRSFTASTARLRMPTVLPLLRVSATPGETGPTSRLAPLPPGPTAPVPVPEPLPGGPLRGHHRHHEQQQLQHQEQGDKQDPRLQSVRPDSQQRRRPRADLDASWSASRTEFFRISDVPSSHIIFPSLATGDGAVAPSARGAGGAAAAEGTVLAGGGAMTTRGHSGTIASFFSRDSAGSTWFAASPNTGNHAALLGVALPPAQRSITLGLASSGIGGGGDGGIGGGGDGGTGDGGSPLPPASFQQGLGMQEGATATVLQAASLETNAAGAASSPSQQQQQQQPIQSPLVACPATAFAGRVRSTLVRAGSRLQFASTLNTYPSIPEDIQAGEFMLSYCEHTLSGTVVQTDSREPGMRLLSSLNVVGGPTGGGAAAAAAAAGDEELGEERLPSIGPGPAGAGLLCVASPTDAAAAVATAVESPAEPPAPALPADASLECGPGSGGRSARSVGSTVLSACCMAPGSSRVPLPLPCENDSSQEGHSPGGRRAGQLAAEPCALGTSPNHGKSQSPTQSNGRSQVATSSSGLCSGSNGRPGVTPTLPMLLLQQPCMAASPRPLAGEAMRPLHNLRGGGGGSVAGLGLGQSRTGSTVYTRSTTVSSAKRLSSNVISPNLVQILGGGAAGGAGLGGITGSVMMCSAMDLTRSANGSSAAAVGSGSATCGAVATGSGSVDAGASPAAQALAANEAEMVRQEVLERGWQTLQQIMQRLNARPGDYLTRIVMEDADQGSLLVALRSGRFGTAPGGGLQTLLLTALDIARGMAFLHRHNVIHGDLKPSNVLLCSDPTDPRGFIAKVSDLGLSRIITRDNDFVQNRESFPVGTVRYLAPEAVRGSSFKASDVWSYAVVLWQLVTGEQAPWPGLRSMQIVMGVLQNELRLAMPSSVYPPLAALVQSCLAHDHKARPAFDDIVKCLQAMMGDVTRAGGPPQVLQQPGGAADVGGSVSGPPYVGPQQEPPSGAVEVGLEGSHAVACDTVPLDSATPAVSGTSPRVSDLSAAGGAAAPDGPPGVARNSLGLSADDPDPLFLNALADPAPGRGPGSVATSPSGFGVTELQRAAPASPSAASGRQRTAAAISAMDPAAAAAAEGGGGAASSFATARCFAATSVSLTGAASSSNALTQMSGSWAQTNTTTTRTTHVLVLPDRDARGSCSSSANAAAMMALHGSAGNLGQATGGGGGGGGLVGGQESLHRPRTFLGAMLPDDLLGGTVRRGGGSAGAVASGGFGGGSDSLDGSALRVSVVGGDLNQQFLEPVHEEQPPTSSSGVQTVVHHGSAPSTDVARYSTGATGATGIARGTGSSGGGVGGASGGDRRRATLASPGAGLSCRMLSGGASALPRMLQAGLIVLGQRESASGQSVPSSRSVARASLPSSGRLEDDPEAPPQQQQQQREQHGALNSAELQQQQLLLGAAEAARARRRSVLSLESLPLVSNPYGRMSGRSG